MKSFEGYLKKKLGNDYVLLAGGSHKALSDFSMDGHSHSYIPHLGNKDVFGDGSNGILFNKATEFCTGTNLPIGAGLAYGSNGEEYTALFSKHPSSESYATILRWGYLDKYLYIARKSGGIWKSNDWEKISAGYADLAGNMAYTGLTGSGTTANLAILSNGTTNGWTLKTLGSNAFTSDSYALATHTHSYLPIETLYEEQSTNSTWAMTYSETHYNCLVYNSSGQEWAYWISRRSGCGTILRLSHDGLVQYANKSNGINDSTWSTWKDIITSDNWNTYSATLFTNFSRPSNTNNLSITIGGTTLTITLGSNAFNSTSYLPLSGGTLNCTTYDVPLFLQGNTTNSRLGFKSNNGTVVGYISVDTSNNLCFAYPGSGYYKIWHSNNDGSGSGLDADLLDGKDSSAFALAHDHPYLYQTLLASPQDSNYGTGPIDWITSYSSTHTMAYVYNSYGAEYSYLIGRNASYGMILKMGYSDRYLRILRRAEGNWLSTDWEKIYAGYADSAGSVAWDNVTGKPTVNNESLTLQTAGTTLTTFYANDSTSRTFNVTCANIGAQPSGNYIKFSHHSATLSGTSQYWIRDIAISTSYNPVHFAYNSSGQEWAYWIGMNSSRVYGTILRLSHDGYILYTAKTGGAVNTTDGWLGWIDIITSRGGQTINGNLTATNFYTSSDINKKTNFIPIPEKELNFTLFTWRKSGLKSYGLIAQLVKTIYPELVDGEDGNMTVNYSAALCLTVGQLQRKIKELEQRLRQLENLNK